MRIHVVYAATDGSVQNTEFTCVEASRQLPPPNYRSANIIFRNGPAYHGDRKILSAQFSHVTAIFTYDED